MTVTAKQVAAITRAGVQHAEHIAAACNKTGCKLYLAVAMIAKESGGRNVWGSDRGGVFRGLPDVVTESSYRAFRHELTVNGRTSNGVGPAQVTYKPFLAEMEGRGLRPWVPADNILFGIEKLWGYYLDSRERGRSNADAIREAGTMYNAGNLDDGVTAYGEDLLERSRAWLKLVGSADYA